MSTIADELISPKQFFLENGLKVVLAQSGAAPIATVLVVYRVGSRNEAVGHTGAAHLLEHMLFKGTERNNPQNGRSFSHIANEMGASFNATTWLDRTMYYETVPVEFLSLALELEADRMRNALIRESDRASEMTVVRNEFELSENQAPTVLQNAVVATAFREHPYHHPTIGWRSDVEGMSIVRLQEFYRTYSRPNNATLFVIGEVDMAAVVEGTNSQFGSVKNPDPPVPEVYTSEPPQTGERAG